MSGAQAEIIYDGQIIGQMDLSQNTVISLDVNPDVIIEVAGGKIRFLHSNCPDKVCVNTGFIQFAGESAVCLPNRLILHISDGQEAIVDAISK